MSPLTIVLLVILVILIMVGIFLFFKHRARKKALKQKYGRVPDHIELYFKEYFGDMIESWDLLKKNDVNTWVDDMEVRLDDLSGDIDELKANKKDIDKNLDQVESRISELESKSQGR